jgi:hypothetical protein
MFSSPRYGRGGYPMEVAGHLLLGDHSHLESGRFTGVLELEQLCYNQMIQLFQNLSHNYFT